MHTHSTEVDSFVLSDDRGWSHTSFNSPSSSAFRPFFLPFFLFPPLVDLMFSFMFSNFLISAISVSTTRLFPRKKGVRSVEWRALSHLPWPFMPASEVSVLPSPPLPEGLGSSGRNNHFVAVWSRLHQGVPETLYICYFHQSRW